MSFVGVTISSLLLASGGLAEGARGVGAPERTTADAMVRRVEREIPGAVRVASERFVLVADPHYGARERTLAILERTADAVETFADRMIDEPRPQRERVLAVAFTDSTSFEHFARDVDRLDASWMSGYWAPGADRVVFRAARTDGDSPERHHGTFAAVADPDATIAHEAAHALLHRLGVQRRAPRTPLWISEGLAVAFEPCGHGADAAFAPQPEREARVRRGPTFALRDLVVATSVPPGDASAVEAFYDESWSLARWLVTERPTEFRTYLGLLREAARENARSKRPTALATFERAFGPVDAVEAAWRGSLSAAGEAATSDRAP
ncbi:MAG: DUF1570 domain-containing protein [Phycisphaerae bacterium]|nr:DUF1570 domain-containing protein [Phycisphaerae bacterium]